MANRKHTLTEIEVRLGPRPTCVNPGCGKPCSQNGRWMPFCSSCRKVSQLKRKPDAHITYLKRNICANHDGRVDLGFPCFTNWKLVKRHGHRISTHMDHIDGNHLNNTAENVQELCPYCHDEKGRRNGDKDGWKNKRKHSETA